MNKIHCHIDDTELQRIDDPDWNDFNFKEMLNANKGGCKEFIFGYGELAPNGKIPFHIHKHEMAVHFLSGMVKVQLGRRAVTLNSNSGAFFPAKVPHAIQSISKETLKFIYTYSCDEKQQEIDRKTIDQKLINQVDILNKSKTRWAVSEYFEAWEPVELSKGYKLRSRYLFNGAKGNTKKMCVSMFDIDEGCHYTEHIHNDPEIYYIISGYGKMKVAEEILTLTPGTAVYLAPNVIHGLDSLGEDPLHTMVIYRDQVIDEWTPVEDIYTEIREK